MKRYLTQQEVETLCGLYLEGRLDIAEERELSKVLSGSDYSGDIIEDCVFLMGIARTCSDMDSDDVREEKIPQESRQNMKIGKLIFGVLRSCVAAACLIMIVSGGWNYSVKSEEPMESVYEVYVNGKKLDPETSRKIALESYHKNMKLIADMREMEREKLLRTERDRVGVEKILANIETNLNINY